jgi:hypothetical protein
MGFNGKELFQRFACAQKSRLDTKECRGPQMVNVQCKPAYSGQIGGADSFDEENGSAGDSGAIGYVLLEGGTQRWPVLGKVKDVMVEIEPNPCTGANGLFRGETGEEGERLSFHRHL